jgi:DNA-binding transcriptional LysR family regulator
MTDSHTLAARLPPLHALQAFAVAARAGSFSRAATQLFVTQSAISRQVQLLEEHLGCALFVRRARGLDLTPEGEALLPQVEETLGGLVRACDSLRHAGQVLTLGVPPTLATRWLLPRLPRLSARLPGVEVRLATVSLAEPTLARADIDASIVYGNGSWPGMEEVALFDEIVSPVCSPALLGQLASPADLARFTLLHVDLDRRDWTRWLKAAEVREVDPLRGPVFDTIDLAFSAATRGQGVAIGDLKLACESLADGILAQPFMLEVKTGYRYTLIYQPQRSQQAKIRALREWLQEEFGANETLSAGQSAAYFKIIDY